jgi:integrase
MTEKKKNLGGRPKTGTIVKTRDGRWQAIVTLADGSRKRMEPFAAGTSKAMAREKAAFWAEKYAALGVVGAATKEPRAGAAAWWHDYFEHRAARGLTPVKVMYTAHILPVLRDKHPRDWTKTDCERVRDALDQKIRAGFWEREIEGRTIRYRFGWKRAWNVWALFTSACKEASNSKEKTLRVREDNPCRDVKPPDRGVSKQKQWLYPTEFSRLMRCDAVPARWRTLYAVLTYAYVRPNELKALRRRDIELDTGLINVTRAWDFDQNIEKANPKTAAGVRFVPIEVELMPLLRQLCEGIEPDAYLFPTLPPPEDWADTFRDHLRRAGLERTKLFENSLTVKNITLYDLRATGITWRTLRGDDARLIQRAAGHEKYATTEGYVREAAVFKGRIGDPFPSLPEQFRSRVPITFSRSGRNNAERAASPRGFEPLLQP